MSDFQKLTIKRYIRNFLIMGGVVLLVYGMFKSELIRYGVLALLVLAIVCGFAWAIIRVARWDWWLRGRLTEEEYEAYQACDRMFGWRDDKYLPTEAQVYTMATETRIDKDTLWSMFHKLTEGY